MADYPNIDVSEADWIDEDIFRPRYNIAPRSNAPVIRRQTPDNKELVIHTMKWGIVPHWSKHEDLTLNTINARAENLMDGGMWSGMKSEKRCVVVCDGYFEWLKKGKDRVPYFIHRKDGKLMILAGLYDSVILEGATAKLWTFTIVTTTASSEFSWLHDRQPVILYSTADFETWLDTSQGWHKGLIELLKPGDGKELECYPVPKEIGRVGANSPEFIKPISQRKDGIQAIFARQVAKGKQTSWVSSENQMQSVADTPSSIHQTPVTCLTDGKTAKRAIDIDDLPSSSSKSPSKKKKLAHIHDEDTKHSLEGDMEGTSMKKRAKTSHHEEATAPSPYSVL